MTQLLKCKQRRLPNMPSFAVGEAKDAAAVGEVKDAAAVGEALPYFAFCG